MNTLRQRLPCPKSRSRTGAACDESKAWFDDELAAGAFKDVRLGNRLRVLVEWLWNGTGDPIPLVCQD